MAVNEFRNTLEHCLQNRLPTTPDGSRTISRNMLFYWEKQRFSRIFCGLKRRWCGRVDSNHHGIATASPSSWCVCQFRHDRVSELNKYRREEPLMRAATGLESRQVAPVSRVPAANLNCLGTGASLQWPTGVPAQAPPDRKPLQVGNCPVLSFLHGPAIL